MPRWPSPSAGATLKHVRKRVRWAAGGGDVGGRGRAGLIGRGAAVALFAVALALGGCDGSPRGGESFSEQVVACKRDTVLHKTTEQCEREVRAANNAATNGGLEGRRP